MIPLPKKAKAKGGKVPLPERSQYKLLSADIQHEMWKNNAPLFIIYERDGGVVIRG